MSNFGKIHSSGKVYTSDIESTLIRGVEDPRPWNLIQIVKDYLPDEGTLLDAGTGTANKLIPLAAHAQQRY